MKTIYDTIKQSVYNPSFYQSVEETPLSGIIRYYVKVSFLLAFVMTIALGALLVPKGIAFVRDSAPSMVKAYFPADLNIHIEKGDASVNVAMPYLVPLSGVSSTTADVIQNILVINTTEEFNKKKFDEYRTFALLTKNEIATQNDKGQITIQSLRTLPTITINQAWLLSWVEKINGSLVYIVLFGLIGTFIALLFGYLVYLILLFLFALIPLFIAYLKKDVLSYRSAYKMSLYAIVPALILKTLLNLLGIFTIPAYFSLLVFMLIIAVNMREVKEPTLFEKSN